MEKEEQTMEIEQVEIDRGDFCFPENLLILLEPPFTVNHDWIALGKPTTKWEN